MTERKFSRGLRKPGMAAQMRETVSQVVRESAAQNKPHLVEPLDFETFFAKNKTLLQNDPQRELLLYPPDDVSQVVLPRKYRTINQNVPSQLEAQNCTLFTRECILSYTANWNLIHYKYSAYSGSYLELPKILKSDELKDEIYEVDTDVDQVDEGFVTKTNGLTKQGYLMKGPEVGSDRMFVNIGSKSFKRRFCFLRQEVDGTYILELHKDDKKGEAKATIVMDFCTEVVRNPKRGRFCFELHMTAGHKSYCLAADSEAELHDWVSKLQLVIQQNKIQEEKRAASLERTVNTPVASPQQHYGTLKGLEQSVNPQLMKYARETDMSIAIARKDNRRRLFSVYPFMPHVKSGSTPTSESTIEPYKEQFSLRFIVRCENLKFRLQAAVNGEKETLCQVEPYFTTLALYDAKEGRKLSEDFHFDINHPQMQNLLSEVNPSQNESVLPEDFVPKQWLRQQRCAIMNVSKPHAEIYLVLRVDKILQGGVCQTAEPYVRSAKDPRLGLKVFKALNASCQRLGKYRMPFVWSARPLFRLYSNELDTSSDFPALYRQDPARLNDDEIIKILAEYRKPDKLNKLTVIPGWIQVKVEPFADLPENSLTCTLTPLKPFPIPPANGPSIEIAELQPNPHPYTYFLNNLYIYPLGLIFDSQKAFTRARNIACIVELRDSDEEGTSPIKCIYGRFGELLSSESCCVLHHTTNPTWYDEIKLKLPIKLTAQHHLLFTFKHISIEGSKKKETGPETNVGYCWVPLLHKGRLNVDTQSLPVAANLPPGYLAVQPLGLGKGYAGPEITWIDGQKPIFNVRFHLMSTVFTTDVHLHNLFAHSEKLQEPKNVAISPAESETCKILKAAHALQLSSAISFLPSLLNQLFGLLVRSTSCEIGINIIRLLVHLVHQIQEAGANDALNAYVKYVFVGENVCATTVHEELCSHLPSLLRPDNTDFLLINKFLPHSGFFFQIMVKSMAQHLLTSGRIKMHRNERFSSDFLSQVECLLQVLTPYIATKHKEMPLETQQLNSSIGHFLKKCLTFMDRGFVFRLINYHILSFSISDSRAFQDMKFSFLQIICSHEHYVAFNLPMLCNKIRQGELSGSKSPPSLIDDGLPISMDLVFEILLTPKNPYLTSEYYLSEEFCRYHFLVGLLLQETKSALNQCVQTRKFAITCLRDLLAKHELDDRYQAKGQLNRIAALYMPWLAVVLENLHHLISVVSAKQPTNSTLASSNGSLSSSVHTPLRRLPYQRDNSSARASLNLPDSTYFAAIAGQTLVNGNSCASLDSDTSTMSGDNASSVSQETAINQQLEIKTHSRSVSGTQVTVPRFDRLLTTEVKDILVCFLFILKHLSQEQIISWWHHCSESDILGFFKAVELSLHEFKYTGRRQIAAGKSGSMTPNETELSSGVMNRQPAPVKAMTLPARMQPPDFSSNDSRTSHAMLSGCNSVGRENMAMRDNESTFLYQALMEANLATEVGLTVLDALGLYCLHFRDVLMCHDGDNPIMKPVFDLYLLFLQVGQSETLFRHVFAALRAFINNFSLALFQGNAVLCGRLCLELLRCCNSRLSAIRQEACAILYLLMRSNFEFSNRKGLTRVHLQVIISVSQLLGSILGLNNARFQESLSLINSYAISDKVMKGTGFPVEVKDLMKRIRTVLMATAQMRELNHDPEMLTDLQHSLANSYAHTPELRFTWLQTMTRNHVRDNNLSEAACCQLHIAALMAQYLKLKGAQIWGAEAFAKISSNIPRDEISLKLDCGIQEIQYSEQSLLEQLETCAEYLEKAERYECLGELYRLIVPIYENRRDFQALAQAYQTLAQAYNRVLQVTKSGKRLLGRFYRVGLFGQAYFEDEHCIEYIYKEPKVTALSEMSERLFNQYNNKFGPNTVKIIMDSASLNPSDLDPKFAHIQVTHVTPYFEKDELEARQSEFEQNHDINQFMFETPFTKDGRARGNPNEQWKRRCILKSEYSFPYVKKRLKVCSRREIELSPIEVALDEMNQRITELEEVVFTKPTDAKKLQLRLQGSICVQVNAGPLAYATAFLNPEFKGKYSDDKVEELKDVFREFVRVCYAALQLNSQVVRSDQTEYQAALRQNFQKLCQDLSQIFGETLWPDQELGSFKRNSQALFSAISGANNNSSSA